MAATKKAVEKSTYDSNPFTLSFNALGKLFNHNAGWAVTLVVLSIMGFFFQIFGNIAQFAFEGETRNTASTEVPQQSTSLDPTVIAAIVIFVLTMIVIIFVISSLVNAFLQGMFSYVALKSEEEKQVSFREAFEETTKRFWRLFLAQLLANLKIVGWTLLLIVPGIIAGLRYSMLPYIIMSDSAAEKGIADSHTKTKLLSKGRLIEVFGISTVATIIPFIGSVVGLSGKAALHNQMVLYNANKLEKPKVHWLNYLGLLLLGLVLLLILLGLTVAVLLAISRR